MRIVMITLGSRGDVQPFLNLGIGLREAGHDVQVATAEKFKDLVKEQGMDFIPIRGDMKTMLSLKSIPYDWLFPQVAVVVHLGDVSTLDVALRAEIPSIVIPFVADNPSGHSKFINLLSLQNPLKGVL